MIEIMLFSPSDSQDRFPIQQCPILLSFFCFLVFEQEIELEETSISMGDIYIHLVKSLYRKFTVRKGIAYKASDFNSLMKSVSKLALRTLMSDNPLLQKSEVLQIVGQFAFDYGLFAGHEDIRLCGDPTADIYVTYPHRSLEEFFGSYGFIQALNEGQSIDDILGSECEEPIFMMNPLVFRFCLLFSSSSDFDFSQRGGCYDKLTSYVTKRIDSKVFDLKEVRDRYPAIDMLPSASLNCSTVGQFFQDVLNKCKHIQTLHVNDSGKRSLVTEFGETVCKFLGLISREFIDKLTKIIIGPDPFRLKDTETSSVILSLNVHNYEATEIMSLLLQRYNLAQKNPQIYLKTYTSLKPKCDIKTLLSKYSKELHIDNDFYDLALLIASGEFPDSPILTSLTFQRQHIDESVASALRRAVHSGKLPSLRRVVLNWCCKKSSTLDWSDNVEVCLDGVETYCMKCLK